MNNSINFLNYFSLLDDPRISGMIVYPMDEVLLLVLCGVISGADSWEDISFYGEENLDFLRNFLPYNNGIPQGQTLRKIFSSLDSDYFSDCFIHWASSLSSGIEGVVAIDGKTLRGNASMSNDEKALHIVSAFAHSQGLVIGQVPVCSKSNEITAIPALLEKLIISGAIITIDAIGCQRKICQQIIKQNADYLISLKGNQGSLHEDVKLFIKEQQCNNWEYCNYDFHEDTYSGHGRIEIRKCWITKDIEWLKERHNWPGLHSIVVVQASREVKNKVSTEMRLYITSLPPNAKVVLNATRAHWSVENTLHWTLDMTFADDANLTKNKNAANNLHIIKKMALNLLKKMPKDRSIKTMRKSAGWNKEYMLKVLKCAQC